MTQQYQRQVTSPPLPPVSLNSLSNFAPVLWTHTPSHTGPTQPLPARAVESPWNGGRRGYFCAVTEVVQGGCLRALSEPRNRKIVAEHLKEPRRAASNAHAAAHRWVHDRWHLIDIARLPTGRFAPEAALSRLEIQLPLYPR